MAWPTGARATTGKMENEWIVGNGRFGPVGLTDTLSGLVPGDVWHCPGWGCGKVRVLADFWGGSEGRDRGGNQPPAVTMPHLRCPERTASITLPVVPRARWKAHKDWGRKGERLQRSLPLQC